MLGARGEKFTTAHTEYSISVRRRSQLCGAFNYFYTFFPVYARLKKNLSFWHIFLQSLFFFLLFIFVFSASADLILFTNRQTKANKERVWVVVRQTNNKTMCAKSLSHAMSFYWNQVRVKMERDRLWCLAQLRVKKLDWNSLALSLGNGFTKLVNAVRVKNISLLFERCATA